MPWDESKPPSYKAYKAEKFNKYINRQMALVQGVKESSLKEEDKKALINKMIWVLQGI